ncbi:TLD-domain-containing protein [Lyophyllum atratum]|nr:TLD-domain-containing protein [Lyophyllum atratum]
MASSNSDNITMIDEAMIDKFATLFSPATPRASPTPESAPMTAVPTRISARPHSFHQEASGSDSEFGSFVSVSATEDPLASLDFESPAPISSSNNAPYKGSASLNFFDKFAQDAKEAADRNKHDVLDELLMHEDDPLYWMKDQGPGSPDAGLPTNPRSPVSPVSTTESDTANSFHDLDDDFFTTKPAATVLNQPRAPIAPRPDHSPSRSSTLALPVTLAPPLADPSTASSSSPPHDSHPLSSSATLRRPSMHQSPSYSTLSSLSSRWMSSLLPSSKSSPANTYNHAAAPSLESIFASDTAITSTRSRSIDRHVHPGRASSQPAPDVQISHGTPFGRTLKASPFASHIYTPPSGAPGYKGEAYDWDKGFSAELERELSGGDDVRERELLGVRGAADLTRRGKGKDVGQIIERRSGGIDLLGRKASTTPVLGIDVADMIRPHLPALARLPRKWTLVYSLDQHGISLNTLYTRCEAHMQPKPGAPGPAGLLVVVKDAGDGLFGAWMGKEGVRPSRGKGYYGSGESFLWKHFGQKFQVFKWTGKNEYVALCEPDFISFGGGDGNYGLYLDDTLYNGSSAACPTFANEPLCSPGPKTAGVVAFECVGLEVWGVGP